MNPYVDRIPFYWRSLPKSQKYLRSSFPALALGLGFAYQFPQVGTTLFYLSGISLLGGMFLALTGIILMFSDLINSFRSKK